MAGQKEKSPKLTRRAFVKVTGAVVLVAGTGPCSRGGNYQALINEALREYVHTRDQLLEETLRRVIREELQRISD